MATSDITNEQAAGQRPAPTLVIRQREPRNLESPFEQIDAHLTPADLFYVRSHFPTPAINTASYRLEIGGAVRHPLMLSYEDLRQMPSTTTVATLECAGNARVFLVPQVKGAQWGLGAVGNAEWTGVPLADLLDRAGLAEEACEVVLTGVDRGTPAEPPVPPEPICYSRGISREKALGHDVLIAYQMNGRDLSPDHGFPVRAIVPGHYGMASVKWLTDIRAVTEPYRGYFQTSDYAYWGGPRDAPVRVPLGEIHVMSQIARPAFGETVLGGRPYRISGVAWSGEAEVVQVEVSTDAGATWSDAEFVDPARRHSWRRWTLEWTAPEVAGNSTLLSRARDAAGNVQPEAHDARYGTYVINHTILIEVWVTGATS